MSALVCVPKARSSVESHSLCRSVTSWNSVFSLLERFAKSRSRFRMVISHSAFVLIAWYRDGGDVSVMPSREERDRSSASEEDYTYEVLHCIRKSCTPAGSDTTQRAGAALSAGVSAWVEATSILGSGHPGVFTSSTTIVISRNKMIIFTMINCVRMLFTTRSDVLTLGLAYCRMLGSSTAFGFEYRPSKSRDFHRYSPDMTVSCAKNTVILILSNTLCPIPRQCSSAI